MQTGAPRPAARYRNERVFRSAEQLLASRPARTSPKPSRWLVFAGGLVLGISATVAGLELWTRFQPAPTPSPAAPAPRTIAAPTAVQPAPRATVPAPTATSPAPTLPATTELAPPAPETTPDVRAVESEVRRRVALVAFQQPPPAPTTDSVVPSSISSPTHFSSSLALRGEYFSLGTRTATIGFVLYRLTGGSGNDVVGTVRIVDRFNVSPLIVNRVKGRLHGRTLELVETEAVNGSPATSVGRTYFIDLPLSNAPDAIHGSWSFGALRGAVSLTVAGTF